MKHLAIGLIVLGLAITVTRVCTLGFDFGLLDVWLAGEPLNWTKVIADSTSGMATGAGWGILVALWLQRRVWKPSTLF